ncbi:MAG: DUF72 domain-containing protein [Patescibacteria group bacterium]|nr:DUF72 domain-containing protein [Patescibacteria group bacterium]
MAKNSKDTIHIGTSGWNYKHWQKAWYPEKIKTNNFLNYYADHFQTVEVNNTFYNLPSKKVIKSWRKKVPKEFIFSVKASRYITHMKKLKNPKESLKRFFSRVNLLNNNLGPILFQLPPNWYKNIERLNNFVNLLPKKKQIAIEFRDQSWWRDDVYNLLKKNNIAFCLYQLAGIKTPRKITADFAYIRLHGPSDKPYQGNYHGNSLRAWASYFKKIKKEKRVKEIYCYFDNDEKGYAPKNAKQMIKYSNKVR